MSPAALTLENLWSDLGFTPNQSQEAAIRHTDGPLYLPAGPGAGKTRVLLWRTLNLLVFHNVQPEEIFLSTFTEKAAFQLKEGLRQLLGHVTNRTGKPFDLSKMYVGTVHSLCQRLIADRRFYPERHRGRVPTLLDELALYFHLYNRRRWEEFTGLVDLGPDPNTAINGLFGTRSSSRHHAVTNCIQLFNRLSEECIDPAAARKHASHPVLAALLDMYGHYRKSLAPETGAHRTDFSLIQQKALDILAAFPGSGCVFKHVIIDEYQDTNTVQERLFFQLAAGHKNICVVGDDDQALYRFRGATVENFVQFPARCHAHLATEPRTIPLARNYRSRKRIVDFYTAFMDRCSWTGPAGISYRVEDKMINAASPDEGPAVIATTATSPLDAFAEIATLVRRLVDEKKVDNPNQIAFLFPSLKYNGKINDQVARMKRALEDQGFLIYAPRAGRFLEVDEAVSVFGVFLHVFGKPTRGPYAGHEYNDFYNWLDRAFTTAQDLRRADRDLDQFIKDRKVELATTVDDYHKLLAVADRFAWSLDEPYDIPRMKRHLLDAPGLSEHARNPLRSAYFERIIQRQEREGQPFTLRRVINRATAIDWSVLDLFYQICGFGHFKHMFDLAERGEDEGPIANLGLISQYLARFIDQTLAIIAAYNLDDERFRRTFFGSYLYALFRRSESEYEDADDPFPRGRIPFLTIHQAKGLEFPVVVLANPRKQNRGPQTVETLVRPLVDREGEPLNRMTDFDIMRMFYVALSRAKNLLIIAHLKGQGQSINQPFKDMLHEQFPRVPYFAVPSLPAAGPDHDDLPRNYSYTSDYLLYQTCPRQYMLFRRYGLVPSRSQTMMFGSLVHRTMDDLHQLLIAQRSTP